MNHHIVAGVFRRVINLDQKVVPQLCKWKHWCSYYVLWWSKMFCSVSEGGRGLPAAGLPDWSEGPAPLAVLIFWPCCWGDQTNILGQFQVDALWYQSSYSNSIGASLLSVVTYEKLQFEYMEKRGKRLGTHIACGLLAAYPSHYGFAHILYTLCYRGAILVEANLPRSEPPTKRTMGSNATTYQTPNFPRPAGMAWLFRSGDGVPTCWPIACSYTFSKVSNSFSWGMCCSRWLVSRVAAAWPSASAQEPDHAQAHPCAGGIQDLKISFSGLTPGMFQNTHLPAVVTFLQHHYQFLEVSIDSSNPIYG